MYLPLPLSSLSSERNGFNKKSAPTEAGARKTQTPIVAKQTLHSTEYHAHVNGICIFTKFKSVREKSMI